MRKKAICVTLSKESLEVLRKLSKELCGTQTSSISKTLDLLLTAIRKGKVSQFLLLTDFRDLYFDSKEIDKLDDLL